MDTPEAVIILTKSQLQEFLGAVALPPFVGHPEADEWDCAPLATELGARVDDLFAGHFFSEPAR